jgi:hypothetical protein
MGHPTAYAFVSRLSIEAMRERLNERTAWHWRVGDSAWLGDYLSARPEPKKDGSLRLYRENGYYVLEMRRGACNSSMHATVLNQLLPLLEAREIKPNSGFD